MTTDPRIDAYIAKAQPFAQPILVHLRSVMHEGCPEAEETIKWGMPHFTLDGAILASFAGFKQHVAFYLRGGKTVLGDRYSDEALGAFGRIGSVKDLPNRRALVAYVKKSATWVREQRAARKAGAVKPRPAAKKRAAAVQVPEELASAFAMKKHAKAKATFDAFPPSHRREYVEWITEAKREETRARRVEQALEWMKEGKPRNWKYVR